MKIRDVMSKSPNWCTPETSIEEVARSMVTCDCGCVPVIEDDRVVGVVTDRDVVIRAVAAGRCPLQLTAKELMSHPVATVDVEDSVETALKTLQENQVRRAPVLDASGQVVGMVSQADFARSLPLPQVGQLLQAISQGIDIGHE